MASKVRPSPALWAKKKSREDTASRLFGASCARNQGIVMKSGVSRTPAQCRLKASVDWTVFNTSGAER